MSYQRHPVEIGPLVFGLVFLGVVVAWGLVELGVVTGAETAWILPVVLIGAGSLGVLLALTKPRRAEARQALAYADTAARQDTPGQTATSGVPADAPQACTGGDPDARTDPTPDTDPDTNADTDTRERNDG